MISVVGVGPGNPEYVTPLAGRIIGEADIIVAGERLLECYATGQQKTFPIKNNLTDVVRFIKANQKNNKIAVLASGDPGMYGILNFLLKHFGSQELEVIPGISSIQLACARLRISWHDAVIASVHGREVDLVVEMIKANEKVVLLTDNRNTPGVVADKLLEAGIHGKKAWICRNLSYENELVQEFKLEELRETEDLSGSVMVIMEEK